MALLPTILSRSDFFDGLPVQSCTFALSDPRIGAGQTGQGEVLTADVGSELWGGSCNIIPRYHDDAEAIAAKLYLLQRSGKAFFVYNLRRPGAALAGAEMDAISTDRTTITIPSAASVAIGAFLSFTYGSDPTRYALHQVVAKSGNVLEVVPRVRPGAAVGAAITFDRPYCKAIIVPGSVSAGTGTRLITDGMSFQWRQTLR